jgi:transcriptional regulator with XRE-family HTH domain
MDIGGNAKAGGAHPAASRSVNDDIRRVATNLALVINHCGLSQSELSRRSGLSRQLINGWARGRGSVSLSATVGQLLSVVEMTLADLLLEPEQLSRRLKVAPQADARTLNILPRLAQAPDEAARKRIAGMAGTFRTRTRLKESPMFVLERLFQFQPEDASCAVSVHESRIGNTPIAQGNCFYHQSTFYVFVESTDPPHQPLIYAFRDPRTPRIMSLQGVSIAPHMFGPDMGSPLTRLVYMARDGADAHEGFDPDSEFSAFIPVDACTVLTTF